MTEQSDQNFVRLQTCTSVFEAQQAEAILGEAGIPCMVRSFRDTALDGLYQTQQGWGEIRVPEDRKAEAEKLLAERAAGRGQFSDQELEEQALGSPSRGGDEKGK